MPILTSDNYDAVRAALDTSLVVTDGDEIVPDAIIGLQIYAGAADAAVIKRDPVAESRTGAEATHITNAAVFFCAAYLAPTVPNVLSERFPDGASYQLEEIDWTEKAQHLLKRANEEIDAVLDPNDTTPGRPTMFAVATGGRGR